MNHMVQLSDCNSLQFVGSIGLFRLEVFKIQISGFLRYAIVIKLELVFRNFLWMLYE